MTVKFEDIVAEIKREGIKNVKFIYPMKPLRKSLFDVNYNDEKVEVECYIATPQTTNEVHNDLYSFFGNYKMYLQADDENFGQEDFYVSDFISLINRGYIKWIRANH